MKLPLYREAVLDGLDLAFRHKGLWVYGLFAAFLGQLGMTEILLNVTMAGSTYALFPNWLALPKAFMLMGSFPRHIPLEWSVWMLWVFGVLLAFGILLLFLSVTSQGALIASAAAAARKRGLPNAEKAWHFGVSHFWRLLFINVFRKCAIVLLAVMVGWGTWNAVVPETTSGMDLFLFFSLFILAILVGMVISFLSVYAAGYVVVEEYPLFPAIAAAWKLFLGHWLVSLEVGCIIITVNACMTVFAALGFLVLALAGQFWQVMALVTHQFALFNFLFAAGIGIYILFIIAMGSIFTVFTTTVWTHLFMKMHKHGLLSKLMHWLT